MPPMNFKDHFSASADAYARHRPHYPHDLFAYLADIAPGHARAWDCGTGNGQAASVLAEFFHDVLASDASASQISQAAPHPRVHYRVATAQDSGLAPQCVDLVTVAQALHWFDLAAFYAEVRRVLVAGGVLAAWCYGLFRTNPAIDAIIDAYNREFLAAYWPAERRYIDEAYTAIDFPYRREATPIFQMTATWRLDDVLGYLQTWSAATRYAKATGQDPLDHIRPAIADAWGDASSVRQIVWPIHLLIGRN